MSKRGYRVAGLLLLALAASSWLIPTQIHATPLVQGEDQQAQADALFDEGWDSYDAGAYQAALEKWQLALKIYREMKRKAQAGKTLGSIVLAYRSLGQYEQALDYSQQALSVYKEINDRFGEEMALYNIAGIYDIIGQYAQASNHYQQALAIAKDTGDRSNEGVLLNNLGLVYQKLGQDELALNHLQQSLEIANELNDREGAARTLANIGGIYEDLAQHEPALDYYRQALVVLQEVGDRAAEGAALNNIGGIYNGLGEYDQALDYYQRALSIFREVGHHGEEGTVLANIGGIYNELGQFEVALGYFQQASPLFKEVGNREGEGIALNHIGDVYYRLGQYEAALYYLRQALAILRDTGFRAAEGATLANIGAVHRSLGQYEQAFEHCRQALIIMRETGNREGEAAALNTIGDLYHSLEEYETSLAFYQQALAIAEDIGDRATESMMLANIGAVYGDLGQFEQALDYNQQALVILRVIGDRAGEEAVLSNIGFDYERLGNTRQAIKLYQQAIEVIETIQEEIKTIELKTAFAHERAGTYEHLINLLWEEGRQGEAFSYAERARARAFLDQLGSHRLDFRSDADATLIERERLLKAEITKLRTQLIFLRKRPAAEWDVDAIEKTQAMLTTREADYSALLIEIKVHSPEIASLVSVDVASLDEVQKLLDPNTTLIEYFVTEDRTLAFTITCDSFETTALEVSRDDLVEVITDFRDFASLDVTYPRSLQQLHEWLIAPLEPNLTTPVVGVIPHGVLHYLPFAALTDGEQYLIDDYVLFTLPSASALRFLQEKGKPEIDTVLVLGNPTTTEPLPKLSFAEQEVEAIAGLYGTEPLLGTKATESAVRSRASKSRVLHVAAHGEYNPDNPLFSTIYLAEDAENDGRLEVHEIYELDLTAATDLVVLSACQTQIGVLSAGDEIIGLNRAFLHAGTPSVIASLWSVDDKATALLMERFHTHLRSGLSKAEALRQAQTHIRIEYPHPYYWAAFVLAGDAGAVSREANISTAPPVAVSTPNNTPIATPVESGQTVARGSTPVVTATEDIDSDPKQETPEHRLCVTALLPLGLVMIVGIRRQWLHHDTGSILGLRNR